MNARFTQLHSGRRSSVFAYCSGGLRAKGKRHLARDVAVKRILGEGSFGQVFEGTITTPDGEERVVLKRTKTQIPGALEMSEMEHVLNVYASKRCPESVAEFMGYCGVNKEEASRTLTPGTWLMWRYQGDRTLAKYMRRRDTIPVLAQELNIGEQDVARTVLKQILLNLQGLHKAGLVHRDVKPSNLVFCEKDRTFKFIDLGACADLRLGTNYVPDESILDRIYCPPEQYVLPTDAPHLAKNALAMVISPMLWSKHKPDRFDVYSAGLIFFQLAVPTMCSDRAIKAFCISYESHGYDLEKWRAGSTLLPRHTEVLDAQDGAGWKLLEEMLKPRAVQELSDGSVSFLDSPDGSLRISVDGALNHEFFTSADAPKSAPMQNLIQRYTQKLLDLEGLIVNQVVETEQQTTTVKKLREQVEQGEASKKELIEEEKKLTKLETGLKGMTKEFVNITKTAFEKFGVKKKVDEASEDIIESMEESMDEPKAPIDKIQAPIEKSETPVDKVKAPIKQMKAPNEDDKSPMSNTESSKRSLFGWFKKPKKMSPDVEIESPAVIPGTAENLVYMGLKFTGLAAKVASDLAKSVKKDAENLMEEIENESSIKRKQRVNDRRFLELLKISRVDLGSKFDLISATLKNDDRFQAIDENRRRILFSAYMRALEERQKQSQEQAKKNLRTLFVEMGINLDSDWDKICRELSGNGLFNAVEDPVVRKKVFNEILTEQEKAASIQDAQIKAESEFKVLLKELTGPAISATSTWPRVKRQIFEDPRYQSIPEDRRRALFEEYRTIVREIENEEQEATRIAELKALKERASRETSAAETRLAALVNERQRLKQEYKKMQTDLEAMESKLSSQRKALASKQNPIQKCSDGSLLFKFNTEAEREETAQSNGSE